MPKVRTTVTAALVSTALLLTASGCGSGDSGGSSDVSTVTTTRNGKSTEAVVVKVEFSGDTVTPNGDRVTVDVGEPIKLEVTADKPGEIHVHSDPEHEFEYPEGHKTFTFTIDRPGMVMVESHTLDKTLLQLQVQ